MCRSLFSRTIHFPGSALQVVGGSGPAWSNVTTLCSHPAQLNHVSKTMVAGIINLAYCFFKNTTLVNQPQNNLALMILGQIQQRILCYEPPPLNLLSQGLPASLYQNPHQTKVEALVIRILEEGIFVYIQTPASPLFDSPSSRIILFLPDPEP